MEEAVEAASLPRWHQLPATEPSVAHYRQAPARHQRCPFPCRPDVNACVAVWQGRLCDLAASAVVVPSNERGAAASPVSRHLFQRAGPQLERELHHTGKNVTTGQARLTKGYNLPARFVIHTATPRYNLKYRTAAEGTLHSCYREVLQLVCDHRLASVGLPCLHSSRRGFPPDVGAHIALRTVRRFLERFADPAGPLLVLTVDAMDAGIYEVLLPHYFPRNQREEECARYQLPEDIGDDFGAPVIPDRAIRIIDNPQHSYQGLSAADEHPVPARLASGLRDFSHMEDDVDRQRLLGQRAGGADPAQAGLSEQLCKQERYERLLRRARTEDLSEISGIGCLYQTGKDRFGRPVICFIGKWFRATEIDLDKALLYLIYLLEPLVAHDYTIVYFHTLTESDNHPALHWIRHVYDVLEYKYKKNLKAFYIVHPTIWTKLMTWWFTTFMAPGIKQKVHNITGVEYLYSIMDMNQLEIPAFITEHDMTINGVRYFRPQA